MKTCGHVCDAYIEGPFREVLEVVHKIHDFNQF